MCYWNFRIPYQSDNLKDWDQVVYVTNKIKQNLKIAPDNGEDMRAGGENRLWFSPPALGATLGSSLLSSPCEKPLQQCIWEGFSKEGRQEG